MERLLDIIIPMYNTPKEYITRALNSINKQKGIDFKSIGVIIIDDCSTKIKYKKSWFKQSFPKLQITYIINKENVGPGVSRQNGIDISEAKYITFLDSDDEFYGNDSLFKVFSIMNDERVNLDAIFTSFVEEVNVDGEIINYRHGNNSIHCLHALYVKKEILLKYNIRFDPKLRYHEDTYFVGLVTGVTKNSFALLDEVTYVWKWNQNSMVRSLNTKFNHFEDYIYSIFKCQQKKKDIGLDITKSYLSVYCKLYLLLASNMFDLDEYKPLKEKYISFFCEEYNNNYDMISKYSKKEIDEMIRKSIENTYRTEPWIVLKEDYDSFIKKLELKGDIKCIA